LLNYATGNPIYPNDPTTDQWFDHNQFTNYRLLGCHVANQIVETITDDSWGWWRIADIRTEPQVPPQDVEPGTRTADIA
jgi:hypothetical protein